MICRVRSDESQNGFLKSLRQRSLERLRIFGKGGFLFVNFAILAVSLFFLSGTMAPALASFDDTDWSWESKIKTAGVSSGFLRLRITPEMFDQSRASLQDLRVLDENRNLVPHLFHWGRVRREQRIEWRAVEVINRTFIPERWVRAILDFGEPVRKNRIKVSLSGQNYRRQARIEGSNDAQNWEIVTEECWLISIDEGGKNFKIDTVDFPLNTFRYLQLTVFNEFYDPQRIEIKSAQGAFYEEVSQSELVPVPVVDSSLSQENKKHETVLLLDLGFRNLPVARLSVTSEDAYFYRGYELLGRNAETEKVRRPKESGWDTFEREVPWQSVQQGILYRIQQDDKVSESGTLSVVNAPYRYLKLRIFNQDNPPLHIDGFSVLRREVSMVFEYESGRTYTLIGGNPKVAAPSYDLVKAVKGLEDRDLPVVQTEPLTPLKHEPPQLPWSERHKFIIWMVLILAVGVMVLLIVRSMKKIRQGNV